MHQCEPQTQVAQPVCGGATAWIQVGLSTGASPSEHPLTVLHGDASLGLIARQVGAGTWHTASGGPLCEAEHGTGYFRSQFSSFTVERVKACTSQGCCEGYLNHTCLPWSSFFI